MEEGKVKAMKKKRLIWMILIFVIVLGGVVSAESLELSIPKMGIDVAGNQEPKEYVDTIKILILLTILTLVPSFLILMTSFTRIVVVLSFLRNALGTPQTPPNQLLIGLALFLTFFVMYPVYEQVMNDAVNPYLAKTISQEEAIDIGSKPIKEFMLKQTREKDLALFVNISEKEPPKDKMDTSFTILVPAFVISELKTAFQIGFLIYIPFIVIDMVVASILMSMGMFMLPPVTIAIPFKLLLFIMVDGWHLVVKSLLESFV